MTKKSKYRYGYWLRPALLVGDCLLFNLLFWVTQLIYPNAIPQAHISAGIFWLFVNISLIPVIIFDLNVQKIFYRRILLERVFFNAIISVGFHALFFLSLIAFFDKEGLPTKFYGVYYLMMGIIIPLWCLVSRRIIKSYRKRGFNYERIVIIGANDISKRLIREMQFDPGFGYKILGVFDNNPEGSFEGRYFGHISELEQFVKDNNIGQIYFAKPGTDDVMASIIKIADDNVAEFFYVPMLSNRIARNFGDETIGSVPIMAIRKNPLKQSFNKMIKRGFDIAFSSLVLLFYYPFVYLPVGLAIKLSSPGPVYFKQQRTGYKGLPFECLKFRSMAVNKESDTLQATKDDVRTTKIGKFIRKTSIDELPQFINVFKGDMSIVGPRPHMLKHTEEYSQIIDQYMVRHFIKPGITGWAQVNGFRGQTDELWKMEKRVENDVWYIENWSFLLDLKIIVRTVINSFKRDENAF